MHIPNARSILQCSTIDDRQNPAQSLQNLTLLPHLSGASQPCATSTANSHTSPGGNTAVRVARIRRRLTSYCCCIPPYIHINSSSSSIYILYVASMFKIWKHSGRQYDGRVLCVHQWLRRSCVKNAQHLYPSSILYRVISHTAGYVRLTAVLQCQKQQQYLPRQSAAL